MIDKRKLMIDILDGMSFRHAGIIHNRSDAAIRLSFLKEIKRTLPEIWEEGKEEGWCGTYRTPALKFLRANKDRILNATPVIDVLKSKPASEQVINHAIKLLEEKGYKIIKP